MEDRARTSGADEGAVRSRAQRVHSHLDFSSGSMSAHPQRRNRSVLQHPTAMIAAMATFVLAQSSTVALELRSSMQLKFEKAGRFALRRSVVMGSDPWLGPRLRGGMALDVTADHVPANGDAKASAPANGDVGMVDVGGNSTVDELKIEALRKLGASLRIGGPGTRRRKFKVVRKKQSKADEARFQNALRRVGINQLNDIEEVQMFKNDGTVLNFDNPRVSANVHTNSYVVTGSYEEQKYQDYLANNMGLGANQQIDMEKLRKLAQSALPTDSKPASSGNEAAGEQAEDPEEESEAAEEKEEEVTPEDELQAEDDDVEGEEGDMVDEDAAAEEEEQDDVDMGAVEAGDGGGVSETVGGCDAAEEHKDPPPAVPAATPA